MNAALLTSSSVTLSLTAAAGTVVITITDYDGTNGLRSPR